ncbi:plasmid partition protein [Streptomyces solisilvae]|uniref:plasmid partition protein n=1 Tax=Streptomyces malaysiensis TaxID=92644 RepID=UPI0036BA595F
MLIANVSPRTAGKTTDSGLMAHALLAAEHPYEVEGYDADHSAQFWDWAQKAKFPFPVHRQPLARFYRTMEKPTGRRYVGIVDCGHTENHPDIADAVLRVADLVIVHMAPTSADFERIVNPPDATPLFEVIERSESHRPDQNPPETWVLLNRCATNARSVKHYREEMDEEGYNVFTATIPRSEVLAQAVGFPVSDAAVRPFATLVTEMEKRGILPT